MNSNQDLELFSKAGAGTDVTLGVVIEHLDPLNVPFISNQIIIGGEDRPPFSRQYKGNDVELENEKKKAE